MSVKTKMTAIADEIRTLSGTDEAMGLDSMASNINEANTEVDSQAELISQIMTALEGKTAVEDVQLPTLANEATSDELLEGKQLINSNNEVVTGTIPSLEAQTITPAITDQTIEAGKYLAGAQIIKGDANLIPGNIAEGVSIFGVAGTMTVGNGDQSGASVGTCTLHVEGEYTYFKVFQICYSTVDSSGNIVPVYDNTYETEKTITCLCNSIVFICHHGAGSELLINCTGCEILTTHMGTGNYDKYTVIWLSAAPNSTATFYVENSYSSGGAV